MLFNFRNLFKKTIKPSVTRTTFFGALEPLHLLLTDKSPRYRNWHALPYISVIHTAVMVTSIVVTIAIMLALIFSSPRVAQSASLTWDGGGSTNDWSECANWTTDTCPTSADTVTFNSTSTKDATVDASFGGVVTSLTITTGYTGTVTLARSLQTSSSYTQTTGTFTAANQTFDIDGNFVLSGGTFTASSGTTYLAGAMSVSGTPIFNHNSGTFEFDSTSNVALACNNITFNSVRFTATSSQKTINSDCTMPVGADPSLGFNIRLLGGTISGSGTLTFSSQFNFSSGTLSGFSGISIASTFTLSGGTADFSSYSPVTFGAGVTASSGTLTVPNDTSFPATFTLSGATFNAPNGTINFNRAITITSGTFNHNNGTVNFNSNTNDTLACGGVTFNLVTITNTSGTKTFNSTCTLPLGANPTISSGGAVSLGGTLSGSGTLTHSGALTVTGTSPFSGFSGLVGSSTFTVNGGTVDLGSFTTVDFNAGFTLTSGTFTAPSGTMTLASNFTYTAGTFNANGGTVTLDGSSGTINCGTVTFNLVTLNYTSSKTVSANCNLPLGSNPTLPTSLTLNGSLSGTGTLSIDANSLTMNSGSSLSGFTGFSKGSGSGNLIVAGATVDMSSYTTFDASSFTISSGSFTAPTAGMSVRANFTASGGTFNGGGSTLTLTSSGTINCSGATPTFGTVAITHTTGNRTVTSCTLPLGANPTTTGAIILGSSTLSGTGTLTSSSSLTINSGGEISGFTGFVATGALTISGGSADFSSFSSVDTNSTLTLSSGTLTAPSTGAFTVGANFTVTGGTFNANSGTVTFDSSSATLTCNNITFNKVVFSNTNTKTVNSDCTMPLGENPTVSNAITLNGALTGSGTLTTTTGTLTLNSGSSISGFSGLVSGSHVTVNGATIDLGSLTTVDINGNFTLSSGTFTAPVATMTVSGTWTNSGGTFNHNNGTIQLDGNSQVVVGANTFYNFTKTVTSRYYLNFPANATQTILGNLTLHGTGGRNLIVRSNTSGSQFSIDPRGNRDVSFLDLKDANNVNGTRINIAGTSSYNAGNNTGWSFSYPGVTNLGAAGVRDGSYAKNSQPTFSFDTSDQDSSDGDSIKYQIQIDDSSDYGSVTVDYTSKLDVPGSYTFTVGQATGDGAYATGSEGQKLSDGTYYWRVRAIDASGATSAYTNGKDNAVAFGIDTTAPTAPGAPKTSSTTDDTTPTWTWSAATDSGTGLASTDTYTFEWCNNSRFEGCSTSTRTTDTAFTNNQLDVTTWYARVKAKDKLDQESSWSEVGIFNLNSTGSTGSSGSSSTSQGDEAESESDASSGESEVRKIATVPVRVVGSDGQPLAGAKAVLYSTPRTATTDANGIAIFTDVEVGEHRLVIAYKDKIGFQRIVVEADGTTSSPTSGASVDTPGQELTVEIQDSQPLIPSIALLAFRIVAAILIILMYLLHLRRHHDFAYLGKSQEKGIL